MRLTVALACSVLAGAVTSGTTGVLAAQAIFRGGVDSVAVDVAVMAGPRAVADLRADEFEVLDNGVPQTLLDLTREALPIDVTLVVDQSGSVTGALLATLRRAVDAVGQRLRPDDTARLITFNQRVIDHGPRPAAAARDLSLGLLPSGHTSLFDAMAVALIRTPPVNRREVVLVFTDGRDSSSVLDEAAVIEVARRANPAVFIVAAVDPFRRAAAHAEMFRTIADLTGGQLALTLRGDDLSRSFVAAFDDFRSSYVLRYTLKGVPRPGWHDVTVRVTRPGSFTVRARKGYFGQ